MGALLSSLFINDIAYSLCYSQHIIFADDSQIYLSCLPSELQSGLSRIPHDVERIATYARDSGLKLNLARSKILIQGSSAFTDRVTSFDNCKSDYSSYHESGAQSASCHVVWSV